jgi:hypothetical protein
MARSKAAGVRTTKGPEPYDAVLSTAPIQYVPSVVLGLPTSFAARIRAIENIPIARAQLECLQEAYDEARLELHSATFTPVGQRRDLVGTTQQELREDESQCGRWSCVAGSGGAAQ